MNARRLNMWSFLLACGAITYWHIKKCRELPWPPQYIYTALVFAMLDIFSLFNEEISAVSSIGFVIAIFVKQGWIADCEHGGTGQVHTTAYLGSSQPPVLGSLADYQNAGNPVQPGQQPQQGAQVV